MTNKNNKKSNSPRVTRNMTKPAAAAVIPSSPPPTDVSETTPDEAITLSTLSDQLQSLRADIASDFQKQKDEIIEYLKKENDELRSEINVLKDKIKSKEDDLIAVEKDVIDMQQYVRRNNIEFCGIPNSVEHNDLENTVINIAEAINVKISRNDIEACHRLKNTNGKLGPKKTIVRFVNRKKCESLHRNKKKLGSDDVKKILENNLDIKNDIYINSNLCPYNKYLWGKCKRLYDNKMINRFWVYNGSIYYALDNDDDGSKVAHFSELENKFPNFNFER